MTDDVLPPATHTFEGDRARYLRHYARVHREEIVEIVRQHREVRRDA